MRCKEVTRLVSESLERQLPWRQRIGIYLHFVVCRYCTRYRRHLLYMRRLMRLRREALDQTEPNEQTPRLSPDARERLKDALRRADG